MAQYTIKDRAGNITGYLSESSGYGCVGCLGLSVLAALIWGGINLYQFFHARSANSRIEVRRVVLPTDALDGYVGEYDYGRYRIKVERRGNKLFNVSPEEFCELVPVAADDFIYARCVNGFQGRAHFESDERGNMTLSIIHFDGRVERAPKVK